jgi:hypothetical protein
MPISFHCEHCGKKIEAPDVAGGKWGKCPGCHNKVYVPATKTAEPDDELRLAPLDTDEETKHRKMLAEEARLRQEILNETDAPEDGVVPKNHSPSPSRPNTLSDSELMTCIISYIRQMADGELDQAEETALAIIPNGSNAVRLLERIALSEIPEPEIADIPQQVLSGLIKTLRSRLRG